MKFKSNLSVGYSQIYLEDTSCGFHFHGAEWNAEEISSMLCVGHNFLIIGTVNSIKAPFFLNVLYNKPNLDFNEWDHVNTCTIEINSKLLISGDFDTPDEILEVQLNNNLQSDTNLYATFICYAGLGTLSSDGLTGNDSYHVYLWPTKELVSKQVLKKWDRDF